MTDLEILKTAALDAGDDYIAATRAIQEFPHSPAAYVAAGHAYTNAHSAAAAYAGAVAARAYKEAYKAAYQSIADSKDPTK